MNNEDGDKKDKEKASDIDLIEIYLNIELRKGK
jgi:hypothetical protein